MKIKRPCAALKLLLWAWLAWKQTTKGRLLAGLLGCWEEGRERDGHGGE